MSTTDRRCSDSERPSPARQIGPALRQPIHCAAVDLGATSGRVIVGTWWRSSLELTDVHRFPNGFRSLGAHDYWDLPGLWAEIQTGLLAAQKRFPKLASVGADAWGVDHVLLNRAGRLVFPTHAYRDARTQPGLARLNADTRASAMLYAETGIPNVFYNASLQLAETVAAGPAVRDSAARCLFLPDYFNFLLSGKQENEISIASTSQLLSMRALVGKSARPLRRACALVQASDSREPQTRPGHRHPRVA